MGPGSLGCSEPVHCRVSTGTPGCWRRWGKGEPSGMPPFHRLSAARKDPRSFVSSSCHTSLFSPCEVPVEWILLFPGAGCGLGCAAVHSAYMLVRPGREGWFGRVPRRENMLLSSPPQSGLSASPFSCHLCHLGHIPTQVYYNI